MEYPKRLYVTITNPSAGNPEAMVIEPSIEEFANIGVTDGAEICIYEVVGKAKLRTAPTLIGETKPVRKGRPFGSKNKVAAPAETPEAA